MTRVLFVLLSLTAIDAALAQQRTLGATGSESAAAYRGQVGRRVSYVCPAIPAVWNPQVWGTDTYVDDSKICFAAIHAGVLELNKSRVVTIVIGGTEPAFKASTRNGVTSAAYGKWPGSYTFDKSGEPGQIDWITGAQYLAPDFAGDLVVRCPPHSGSTGAIWGTDTYALESPICVAAVHANVITAASGGLVRVTAAPGQASYKGSQRNGISSQSFGKLGASFRVAAGPAFIGPTPISQAVTQTASASPPGNGSSTTCGVAFATPCVVALNPASIKLTWSERTDANKYQVFREDRLVATVDAPTREFIDEELTPGQTANYVIKAVRVTGTISLNGPPSGRTRAGQSITPDLDSTTDAANVDRLAVLETSTSQSATTPALGVPTRVVAQSVAGPKGRVRITWAPVTGANGYLVYRDGNPLPVDSGAGESNSSHDTGVPLGRHRYQVEALFTTTKSQRTVNGQASAEAFAEVAFPKAGAPYLSRQGEPASADDLRAHYRTRCKPEDAALDILECADIVRLLDANSNFTENWLNDVNQVKGCATCTPNWTIVEFADAAILGLGRRVNCAPRRQPTGPILCWATSHGSIPAQGAAVNGAALASTAESAHDIKSLNVILSYPNGQMFFGTWESKSKNGISPFDREFEYAKSAKVHYSTVLDSENVKPVPHVCLSCHGGRYDTASRMVLGASLLPLIPGQLHFSSPQARAKQEEAIRQINEIVLSSNPAPAIVAQINALYDSRPTTAGTRANDAAVPNGWRFDANIYRQVIEPYCASCHFSREGAMSFATASNVKTLKGAVQNSICNSFTMPHSEVQFRRFWTEGGELSLPGLLSTWLGFNTCGPL